MCLESNFRMDNFHMKSDIPCFEYFYSTRCSSLIVKKLGILINLSPNYGYEPILLT